ncbi:DnaD domain protein, partial [Carnobacterium inhibens]|uniref:DnaD domain protein n=1 Tax=Carnobacterium inhibens TaxID=147709 RepID=UPI001FCFABE2
MKVANDLGTDKRNMAYLRTILKDWKNRGFKVGEDFDAEKKRKSEKQAKKSAPRNNFNKGTVRKETIPEHIMNPDVKETPMSEE